MSGTSIDAAAALALTADLYRQLADCRQQLAQVTAELAALRAAIRDDAGVPPTEVPTPT